MRTLPLARVGCLLILAWSRERPSRPPGPADSWWRHAVLDALDLLHVWGADPVSRTEWTKRYRPGASAAASAKAWERLKGRLRSLGLSWTTNHNAGEIQLDEPSRQLVSELVRVLDEYLLANHDLSRPR